MRNGTSVWVWLCAVLALTLGVVAGQYWLLRADTEQAVERTRIEAYERGLLNGAKATAAREARRAKGAENGLFEQCMSHNRALRFTVQWMENRNELGW